jgi:predicted DNA-binding transcriptional regulator AlpA
MPPVDESKRPVSDWISVEELIALTGRSRATFYQDRWRGTGPFAGILTKLGGRLGCWRADYDALVAQQRRIPPGSPDNNDRGRGSDGSRVRS